MEPIIQKNLYRIRKFEYQRVLWVRLSFLFLVIIAFSILFYKDIVESQSIILYLGIVGFVLPLAVIWWYWTMRLIKIMLKLRQDEITILNGIVLDVKDMKEKINSLTARGNNNNL